MKQNDVEAISSQFGISKEIVEASVTDGTLSVRIADALKEKVIYDKQTFEAFKKNHATEVTTSYFNELVDKARKGDLPTDLYTPIKGAAYQQKERELSKKLNIENYKDIDDLIEQAISKTSANGHTKLEIEKQINDLKAANLRLIEEKENAVKTVETEYKSKFLSKELSSILNNVPFDFADVKPEELADRKRNVETILTSVFNQQGYKLDFDSQNRIVALKGADVLKNQATLEPLPVIDVLTNLAKTLNLKLSSPDTGGQGGKSSHNSSDSKLTAEAFQTYLTANKIDRSSAEAMKIWRERGAR